jgi:uncharacterized delta-60 repeat protein
MLLQNDNKIDFVVTGCDQAYHSIVRFNEDGTIDSTFAENGYLYLPDSIFFGDVTIQLQPDGKILIAAGFDAGSDIRVARFLNDGSADLIFGANGIALVPIYLHGYSILRLQPDGKILLATNEYLNFLVARLLNDIALLTSEINTSSTLRVYPNPVSDQLLISETHFDNKQATILITDAIGQIVKIENGKFKGSSFILHVDDLLPGLYFIIVKSENSSSTTKFVKQ